MIKQFNLNESQKQFVKYGLVGVMNTGITWLAMLVLMNLFHVSHMIANPIGYILGLINSFIMNKSWTFKSTGPVKKESYMFFAVFIVCFFIQYLLSNILLIETLGIEKNIAQLPGMVVYTVLGYFGNKLLTFKK